MRTRVGRLGGGRYAVLDTIGRGGMGAVYRCRDLETGRLFALKEVRPASLEELEQIRREAGILSTLRHPSLPRIHDYFTERGACYLIMDFIEGRSLDALLEAAPEGLDERTVLTWAIALCRVLHYLHRQPRPIVFRDLKPANVLLTPGGRLMLVDFGIARFWNRAKERDTFALGTPGYAAPEQYGAGQTDERSDLYALGATLHHCLSGRPPVRHPRKPAPLRSLNPRISELTAAVVARAVETDPERRYPTAAAMKRDLCRALLALPGAEGAHARTRILEEPAARPSTLWGRKPRVFLLPLPWLGCAGRSGRLEVQAAWIHPLPARFTESTPLAALRVDPRVLRTGRLYRPTLRIHTDAGVLKTTLSFRFRRSPLPYAAATLLLLTTALIALFLRH